MAALVGLLRPLLGQFWLSSLGSNHMSNIVGRLHSAAKRKRKRKRKSKRKNRKRKIGERREGSRTGTGGGKGDDGWLDSGRTGTTH